MIEDAVPYIFLWLATIFLIYGFISLTTFNTTILVSITFLIGIIGAILLIKWWWNYG